MFIIPGNIFLLIWLLNTGLFFLSNSFRFQSLSWFVNIDLIVKCSFLFLALSSFCTGAGRNGLGRSRQSILVCSVRCSIPTQSIQSFQSTFKSTYSTMVLHPSSSLLAVQNSSICDLVSRSLTQGILLLTYNKQPFMLQRLQSPGPLSVREWVSGKIYCGFLGGTLTFAC